MLFIFSLPPAMTGNACRNILTSGFYHEYSRAPLRDRAMYAELCASNYQVAREALAHLSGDTASFGVSFGLFSPAESGAYPFAEELLQDQFNQWKSAHCSTTSFADSSRAAEFLMQEALVDPASPTVSAWRDCMKNRDGLSCWGGTSPSGSRNIVLSANWRKSGNSPAEVQHSFLSRSAVSNFKGAPTRHLLPMGHKLDNGTLEIPLTSLDDAGIIANLILSQERGEYSCNVLMPGEKDFVLLEPSVGH